MNSAYLAEDEKSGTSKVLLCLKIWQRTVKDLVTRSFVLYTKRTMRIVNIT